MINGKDFYVVMSAVVPLYVAMIAAYGSVRWWKILTPVQCGGINRFVSVFAVPLLSFKFISLNNPYTMNVKFITADVISKVVVLFILGLWARYTRRGSFDWMITIFMLATLPNTLVMGIPLLLAMYGTEAGNLVIQAVVLQCVIWYTLLLFMYEYRAAKTLIMDQFPETAASIVSFKVDSDVTSLDGKDAVEAQAVIGDDGKLHVQVRRSVSSSHGLGLDHLHSSRRSQGLLSMPSSKALTPRTSNLTGAEIYSLHSSVNLTPRESSFNHTDFYSMISGRGSPRHSNFNSSDAYSLHSSRGPTPRTSNFNEENSKDLHAHGRGTSPRRFPPPVYHSASHVYGRTHAGGFDGNHIGVVPRGGPYPGQSYPAGNVGVYSPTPSAQINKKVAESKASPKLEDPKLEDPKLEDDAAKELHMFVWSSSASPVSEAGLHVCGNNDIPVDDAARNDADPKEVRLLVRNLPESNSNGVVVERVSPTGVMTPHGSITRNPIVPSSSTRNATLRTPLQPVSSVVNSGPEVTRENYDEYVRDDFSFGNSKGLDKDEFPDKDGPNLSRKFGSSSTAELTPKLVDLHKDTSMPPTRVMVRLIMVMVFRKLIRNPNTYSSLIGVVWSLVSYRWHLQLPLIIQGSIAILSNCGLGMAMFSLGLFMALQGRLIVCGPSVAVFAMAVRFITGPAAMAAASVAVGLKGPLLHAAIVQAALPQGIVPFVFAKDYNLHPDVLSTAVIFGMLIAFPITLVYYVLFGL